MRTSYWTKLGAGTVSRRRLLKGSAVTGIGLAGIGLVGCGDDDDDEPGATATTASGQTPSASPSAETGQPVSGGTLRIAENSAPATWDAYVNSSGTAQSFWGAMTNRVLRLDPSEKDAFRLEPDVAASMPEQPDAQQIIVKVRDDVKFQDVAPVNGRTMTAHDIAFSIQRYMDIGQQKSQLAAIANISVPDDSTVILDLNRPTVSLIPVLGDPKAAWIMAKEVAENEIGPQGPFIGTGPFIFDGYDTDVQISYRKNPDYFETGLPYVDRFEAPIIESLVTEVANFRSGQLHHYSAVDKSEYEELRGIPGMQVQVAGGSSMPRQEFALHVPPFNNRLVRQAMSMAIDRDEMAAATDFIDYKWATHPFPAKWGAHVLDPQDPAEFGENAKYFQYNPTEAKAMLSAAGYPDGFETSIIFTPYYVGHQIQNELMVDQFAKVGVKLSLISYTYTEYQEKYKNSKPVSERLWEGLFSNQPASYTDPSLHFTTYWLPSATRTVQLFEDAVLEDMYARQDKELDAEARTEILREMQRHMAFEMNGAPLNTQYNADILQAQVRNFSIHKNAGGGRAVETYARLWLDDKA